MKSLPTKFDMVPLSTIAIVLVVFTNLEGVIE